MEILFEFVRENPACRQVGVSETPRSTLTARSMRRIPIAALAPLLLLPACNSGIVAAVGGGSDSNAPSSISAFSLAGTKQSPAELSFRVVDADGDQASVELYYELPGLGVQLLTQLGGASNPGSYAGSPEGQVHPLSWDFAAEPGFPAGEAFEEDVLVYALLNGSGSIVPGANAITIGLGNDAPRVDSILEPATEIGGVVPIKLQLSDSSNDLVAVRVEYEIEGSGEWQLARPAGLDSTPELAIVGQSAPKDGVDVTFFWDTAFDLAQQQHEVRLRFTPEDSAEAGEATVSAPFVVDNNDEALIDLDDGLLVLNALDDRGGVALPFTLRDAESDPTRVVFQWRFDGQSFPDLPTHDLDQIIAIQEDPALRAQYQVCGPRAIYDQGRAKPVDETHVRLPELGTSETVLTTPQYAGRTLELMRHPEVLVQLESSWSSSQLSQPVGIVPAGDELEAWVLDADGDGWRVRRIALDSGAVLQELAQGQGVPTALAMGGLGESLFVASHVGPSWSIARLASADGALLGEAFGTQVSTDGVRGLSAISEGRALFTVDDSLSTVSFAVEPPQVATVLDGLATPWGVVVHPRLRDTVYLAEHGADRVLRIELAIRELRPVPGDDPLLQPPLTPLEFSAPRALALERNATRLLVTCEDGAGGHALRATNLGSTHDLDGSGHADSFVFQLAELGSGVPAGLTTGADGLRLLARPTRDGLDAMGGVEQRRTITQASPSTNVVELDAPLQPALVESRPWRVLRPSFVYPSSPEGESHLFAWNSEETVRGGDILLRALPFDSELGFDDQTTLARPFVSRLDRNGVVLDTSVSGAPTQPELVDLDGGGDLDLLVSETDEHRYYLQTAPGQFAGPTVFPLAQASLSPAALLPRDLDGDGLLDVARLRSDLVVEIFRGVGPLAFEATPTQLSLPVTGTLGEETGMLATDLDGDLDLDLLVHATFDEEESEDGLYLYYQSSDGSWSQPPVYVGSVEQTSTPRHVVTGDVNGDGLVDLVSANIGVGTLGGGNRGSVTIFFQEASGDFASDPLVIGFDPDGPFNTTDEVQAVELADLDEDGDLDLLTANGRTNLGGAGSFFPVLARTISVFWQVAPGEFAENPLSLDGPEGVKSLGAYYGVRAVDVDGDGDLDVVGQGGHALRVFLASEPGVFDEVPYSMPYVPLEVEGAFLRTHTRLEVADIEGDGDLDLLYFNPISGSVELRSQVTGIETFSSEPVLFDEGGVIDGILTASPTDWDGDGDLDIATSHGGLLAGLFSANNVQVRFQAAPRSFGSAPLILDKEESGYFDFIPTILDAADLDQDGRRDLIVLTKGINELVVFFHTEEGLSETPVGLPGYVGTSGLGSSRGYADLHVTDHDLDGVLEIVAVDNTFDLVYGYDQDEPGELYEAFQFQLFDPKLPFIETPRGSPRAVRVAELDESGLPSIVVGTLGDAFFADPQTPRSLTFPGTAPGEFSPDPIEEEWLVRDELLEADLEGDGDLDLISIGSLGPGEPLGIVLQRRAPDSSLEVSLVEANIFAAVEGQSLGFLELVDVDLDGDLDLLFLEDLETFPFSAGKLSVIEQIAPGLFAAQARVLVPSSVFEGMSFHTADVDGDGELDVYMTNGAFTGSKGGLLWGNE